MKKKIALSAFVLFLVAVTGSSLIYATRVKAAASVYTTNLLKSTTVANKEVELHGSMKFALIDMRNATESGTFTLPPLAGNNGMVYFIKQINEQNPNQYGTSIEAASGDAIDDRPYGLAVSGFAEVILVADEVNGNWWVMSVDDFYL